VYPDVAQRARAQGIVVIEATIGPDGKGGEYKIMRSIPLLDAAAVAAVQQWEFTPTLLNGVPVSVIMGRAGQLHGKVIRGPAQETADRALPGVLPLGGPDAILRSVAQR